eukprot:10871800-Lingulodinium_polyedra.AAC.1
MSKACVSWDGARAAKVPGTGRGKAAYVQSAPPSRGSAEGINAFWRRITQYGDVFICERAVVMV